MPDDGAAGVVIGPAPRRSRRGRCDRAPRGSPAAAPALRRSFSPMPSASRTARRAASNAPSLNAARARSMRELTASRPRVRLLDGLADTRELRLARQHFGRIAVERGGLGQRRAGFGDRMPFDQPARFVDPAAPGRAHRWRAERVRGAGPRADRRCRSRGRARLRRAPRRGRRSASLASARVEMSGNARRPPLGEPRRIGVRTAAPAVAAADARSPCSVSLPCADFQALQHAPEIGAELLQILVAIFAALGQRAMDDDGERRIEVGVDRGHRLGRLGQDPVEQRHLVLGLERLPIDQQLVEHGPDREDVALVIERLALAPARATCSWACPSACPTCVSVDSGPRAIPKSRIFTRCESRLTIRFAGFTSRWTMPCLCA